MFPPPTLFCYFMAALLIPRAPAYHYASDAEKEFWRQVRVKPSESLSRLRHRYRDQAQRLRNMEAFVPPSEAKLRRAFRDLAGKLLDREQLLRGVLAWKGAGAAGF